MSRTTDRLVWLLDNFGTPIVNAGRCSPRSLEEFKQFLVGYRLFLLDQQLNCINHDLKGEWNSLDLVLIFRMFETYRSRILSFPRYPSGTLTILVTLITIEEIIEAIEQVAGSPKIVEEMISPDDPVTAAANGKRTRLDEANIMVREYIAKHGKGKTLRRDDIAESLGVSAGMVSKTPAWKAYKEGLNETKNEGKIAPRAVHFSDRMLASIPTEDPERELRELIHEQRWRLDELRAWVYAGCPDRDEWTVRRAALDTRRAR